MNILLVDDDKGSRESVGEFLREISHYVVECDNGYDALEIFIAGEFHMILSDIKMPKMSGLELLHEISALPCGQSVKFAFITGCCETDSEIEALRAKAYSCLFKPLDVKELAALIERIDKKQALC